MRNKNLHFYGKFTDFVRKLQIYRAIVDVRCTEYTFKLNPSLPLSVSQQVVRLESSRTRRTSLRTELNLHEISVGVPCSRCNAAPVDVSDFQPGISMHRESRFVDACHVDAMALHSCGGVLKGRHVMPFSQSLCWISVKERPLDLDLFCKACRLTKANRRRIDNCFQKCC